MAKKYYQGDSGFEVLGSKSSGLKPILKKLKDYKMSLYLETEDGTIAGIPRLKLISDDIKVFQQVYKILSSGNNVKSTLEKPNNQALFELTSFKFRLYKSGGRLTNIIDNDGNMLGNKVPSTAQQEDAVRYILEAGSTGMPSKEKINKFVGFEFGKDWHDSFVKSYAAVTTIISKAQLATYNFYRDSNPKKSAFLNQLTDEKYLPDSKDNWNPADIWAVKKTSESKLSRDVGKVHEELKAEKAGIEKLNALVKKFFDSKEMIGISLKKVAGATATIKKIQVDANMSKNISYTGTSSKFAYNVENSYFDVLLKFQVYKEPVKYRFRFRPRAASGQLKTYGEGQPQDAKVFDGAISSDLINRLFPKVQAWTRFCESGIKLMNNVYDTLASQTEDEEFAKFIVAGSYSLLTVSGINDRQKDPQKIRRACVLLYYIWQLEKSDKMTAFPQMYMAAKKMNSFSSVHYKVS